MIYEIEKEDYPKVLNLFTQLKTNTAIESIFSFKNEARLFVDNVEEPKSVLVLSSWAYYYLAGDSTNEEFNQSMVEFLENDFFPDCVEKNINTDFMFYPDNDKWCEKIEELFSNWNLTKSGKTYFSYNEEMFNKNWRDEIPEGFKIEKITQDIIDAIDNNKEFIDYIEFAWLTLDKYFENGFGYCAVSDEDFATICVTVFASDDEREVGIKTFSGFQRKGLAYLTACAYLEECLERNLVLVWSCFSDNEKSIKLARKLGYSIKETHTTYFCSIVDEI